MGQRLPGGLTTAPPGGSPVEAGLGLAGRPAVVGDAGLARDLVLEVQHELAVAGEVLQESLDVAGYIWLACCGISLGQLRRPTMVTLWRTTVSPGTVSSQFPPVSAARSTMTEPGRMPNTASSVMSTGARLPGIAAVVMTASASATYPAIASRSRSCCSSLSSAA